MSSVYTDEASTSRVARRLSVLPALVGLLGVCWVLVGSFAAGVTDSSRNWTWALVVATLVLATVVTGNSLGLYLGLVLLGFVGLAVTGPPGLVELVALALTLLAVNETVRFSLDARRPSRFGPGLVGGYLLRSGAAAATVAAIVVGTWQLAERPPSGAAWVPIGLAGAGLPLFARPLGDRLEQRNDLAGPIVRAALAAMLTAIVVIVVVMGAQARTGLRTGPDSTLGSPTTTVATTTTTAGPTAVDPETVQRGLTLVVILVITIALGVLYLALRRPEAVFELDDIDPDDEDESFGLATPGRAEQDDEIVEVDEDDLAGLLHGLRLDIETEQDPGRAIRFGYANIELRLGELRLTRGSSETEREFLTRTMSTLGSAMPAMATLTTLFERARFDDGNVDEAMRRSALAAIGDLLTEVDRSTRDRDPHRGQLDGPPDRPDDP